MTTYLCTHTEPDGRMCYTSTLNHPDAYGDADCGQHPAPAPARGDKNEWFTYSVEDTIVTALDEIAQLLANDTEGVAYELVATVARAYADLCDIVNEIADYS